MKLRDNKIDNLRTFAIMHVIFIHCLFWIPVFVDELGMVIKSLLLIEMSLFFYLTGASNSLSSTKKYSLYLKNKMLRIAVPIIVYSHAAMIINLIWNEYYGLEIENNFYFITSWILPSQYSISNVPYLTYALWFIPVYIGIMLMIPLLKKLKNNIKTKYIIFYITTGLIMLSTLLNIKGIFVNDILINIIFYIFFTYLGLFYNSHSKQKISARSVLKLVTVFIILILIFSSATGISLIMQNNKFPPNMIFFLYSCSSMVLIYLLSDKINNLIEYLSHKKLTKNLISSYKNNVFVIYLFHPLVFVFIMYTLNLDAMLNDNIIIEILFFIICCIISIILSSIIGNMFAFTEKFKELK